MYHHECSLMYIPLKIYMQVWVCQVWSVCVYVCMYVCVWVSRVGSPRPLSGLGLDSRRAVRWLCHWGGRQTGGVHVGVVTSRQRYVNPLVDRDEVRLSNRRKTKVLSVRPDKRSTTTTTTALAAWEISHTAGPSAYMQRSTYGILMMERRLALTRLQLMVSKCPPVKMYFLFG